MARRPLRCAHAFPTLRRGKLQLLWEISLRSEGASGAMETLRPVDRSTTGRSAGPALYRPGFWQRRQGPHVEDGERPGGSSGLRYPGPPLADPSNQEAAGTDANAHN